MFSQIKVVLHKPLEHGAIGLRHTVQTGVAIVKLRAGLKVRRYSFNWVVDILISAKVVSSLLRAEH